MTTALSPQKADPWAFLDRQDAHAGNVRKPAQNGRIVYGMTFEDYAAVPALNGSRVLGMRRSPMAYKYALDNPHPETPAMKMGTITHRLILEPHLVGEFAIWGAEEEQKVRRGSLWEKFQAENADKTILTVAEYETVSGMSSSALQNAPVRRYAYAPGSMEVSLFWNHPRSGRPMKARLDKILTDAPVICDLKTTRNSEPWPFAKQAWGMGYLHKMAHYWEGYRIITGVEPDVKLLAIENKLPCEGAVYSINRDHLLLALEQFEELVYRIEECEASGVWPSANVEEQELQLVPWATSMDDDTALDLEL